MGWLLLDKSMFFLYIQADIDHSERLFSGLLLQVHLQERITKKLSHLPRVLQYVAATQPINALAFVFDGVNYGASDLTNSAYSMIMVALVSVFSLYMRSSSLGFTGIWIALSIYMTLRIFAGFWRIGTGSGPWSFLKENCA